MSNPFDTGIRLTVVRDPARVRCDVDEFVLCPTNARADEAITARDEWQRLAQAEAWDHLVTRKQLVEAEVALAQAEHLHAEAESGLRAERDFLSAEQVRLIREREDVRAQYRAAESAMLASADADALMLTQVGRERDAAVHLHAEAESDLARVSVRLVAAEARDHLARIAVLEALLSEALKELRSVEALTLTTGGLDELMAFCNQIATALGQPQPFKETP